MVFKNYENLIYIVLITFVPLVLLILYAFYRRRFIKQLIKTRRGQELLVNAGYLRMGLKESLVALALLLCAFTLLRPSWGDVTRKVEREGADILIGLDVSMSMLAPDVKPNRLARAKQAIRWIAESQRGGRIGLIVFAGDAFMMCPLTTDMDAFFMFLDSLGPGSVNLQGTDFGQLLHEAERVFSKKRMTSKMFIIISDGEDHEEKYEEVIPFFKENNIEIYSLGIGLDGGEFIPATGDKNTADMYYRDLNGKLIKTKKNPVLLKKLAQETSGKFIDITRSFSGLSGLISKIDSEQQNSFGSKIIKEKKEQTWLFLLLLLIILIFEPLIGERKRLKIGNGKKAKDEK